MANERKQTILLNILRKVIAEKGNFSRTGGTDVTEPVRAIELTDEELLFQTMAGETDLMAPNLGRLFFLQYYLKLVYNLLS